MGCCGGCGGEHHKTEQEQKLKQEHEIAEQPAKEAQNQRPESGAEQATELK